MIFISRMKDEGIVIGDDIVITIEEIQGGDVRLNVERPPGVPVEKRDAYEAAEQLAETSSEP